MTETPPNLPTDMTYGQVTGIFILAVGDGTDSDHYPDGVAATGTVTFTPGVPYVIDVVAVPPVTIVPHPIVCTLDVNGQLVDTDANPGVYLIATDNPDLNPTGWTYSVRVALTGLPAREFSISVAGGTTQDLSLNS